MSDACKDESEHSQVLDICAPCPVANQTTTTLDYVIHSEATGGEDNNDRQNDGTSLQRLLFPGVPESKLSVSLLPNQLYFTRGAWICRPARLLLPTFQRKEGMV
ncbi:hypothetical protein K2173_011443 [Erythroxylum novogranatense]|uniref:Uncharacterized protein n=1 Tax=Erythroxylum novogranatense TaxID=1862640 RepID=A0AAV8TGQ9_9ROSI|nr:hypothetical protein K2173_011443 [Erythroxylum novogranatense]